MHGERARHMAAEIPLGKVKYIDRVETRKYTTSLPIHTDGGPTGVCVRREVLGILINT